MGNGIHSILFYFIDMVVKVTDILYLKRFLFVRDGVEISKNDRRAGAAYTSGCREQFEKSELQSGLRLDFEVAE